MADLVRGCLGKLKFQFRAEWDSHHLVYLDKGTKQLSGWKSHRITQNHRMAWVGRDLKDHESPTPLPGRATNLPIH